MSAFTLVWQTIGLGLLAAFVHELTHAVVAKALGRESIRLHVREVAVTWDVPADGPDSGETLIGIAPILVGVAAAPVLLVAVGLSLPVAVAWIVYTLNGIPNDLRVRKRLGASAAES